ncbi:MAG: hypothetical protein ACRDAW_00275 [Metamycoplasmataceae bacterium]
METTTQVDIQIMEKINFFQMFKKYYIFIFFSFINAFLPIALCLIASTKGIFGSEMAISIGFSSPFQLVFLNLPFILTFWILIFINKTSYKFIKKTISYTDIFWMTLVFNAVIGVILSFLFFLSSYFYINFFYFGTNAKSVAQMGQDFVSIFTPSIFINSVSFVFIMLTFIKSGSGYATILEALRFVFIILFCFIFNIFSNLNTVGIGLGFLLGSILSLIINAIFNIFLYKPQRNKWDNYKIEKKWLSYSVKKAWKIIIIKVFASLTKPLIFFVIGAHKVFQDYNFMISKTLWYFALYFVPFFSDGITKMFDYQNMSNDIVYTKNKINYQKSENVFYMNFIVTCLIAISFYFSITPLAKIFIINDESLIKDGINVNIPSIQKDLLAPGSTSIIFTLFYCLFNGANSVITKIKGLFVKEKEEKILKNIIMILVVMAFIIVVGLLLERNASFEGLSGFALPMLILSSLFFLLGITGWIFFKRAK